MVSWAAAWRTGLQSFYDAVLERLTYKLERQALVNRANLVREWTVQLCLRLYADMCERMHILAACAVVFLGGCMAD